MRIKGDFYFFSLYFPVVKFSKMIFITLYSETSVIESLFLSLSLSL